MRFAESIVRDGWLITRDTAESFHRNGGALLGGALAFYTLLSAAPVLFVAARISSALFQRDEALNAITEHLGPQGTALVRWLVENTGRESTGAFTIAGVVILLYAGGRLFVELQRALNLIWRVPARPRQSVVRSVAQFAQRRLLAFAMVGMCGVALLCLLIVKTVLAALTTRIEQVIGLTPLWKALEFGASFLALTGLFACVYRLLPDTRLAWPDIWMGAALTSLLYGLSALLLGLYFEYVGMSTSHGAAGSAVVLLLWLNGVTQSLLLGAEFTGVWARRHGRDTVIPPPPA